MKKPRNHPPPPPVNGAKWIPLTKGLFALVDDDEFEWASRFTWTAMVHSRTRYAYYKRRGGDGKYKTYLLHRLIMKAPPGLQVDHLDGNGLNCLKSNMRVCTVKENHRNIRKCLPETYSKFKGVTWDKSRGRWAAKVKCDGKCINLGRFFDEQDAAKAYDAMASKLFGEFARLNLP